MQKKYSVAFFHYFRRAPKPAKAVVALLLSIGTGSAGLQAQGPAGGVVRAGDARVTGEGTPTTRIEQFSDRAIIDWRSFGIGAGDQVVFLQPSAQAATLNRVTGDQVSVILGRLDANGRVLLINPNGVVFGRGAQVNVGSLIATTSNISDQNFLAGKLVFDQPGRPGAGIFNAGALTARDSGLVALVAPHVRNDGVIMARLGKVLLGSADTFTVDLYGDALINLALSENNAGQLIGLNGQPVTSLITNTGRIETAGGQTVLMTARGAKAVLDNLINMSGTIKADTAVEQGGRILLLAEGGKVDVTGTLSAQGATGGAVEVLGDKVHLGSTAALDASGTNGGGIVQVGGAYQGEGDTYRSVQTTVDAGAALKANATEQGNGGQVVVWSDGNTRFQGAVEAKGGATGGDGGRLEVSGKGTLDFLGQADASAANGHAGSLLLDPAFMNIGAAEASTITRVLRTGTTANLQADVDITVDSAIFGGDREKGGGLNMTAGNNINVNDFIVTNDGAINMAATQGTVNVAAGKALFAGSAPITVTTGGTLHTAPLLTTGAVSLQSLAGSVAIDSFIDDHTGPVSIKAAGTVDINQPIVNMANGSALTVAAGTDVNVNAQIDGRGGATGGAVTMTAIRDLNVNQAVVTNNGTIALTATNGAMNAASGTPLVAGSGAIGLTARGDISSGPINAGSLTIASTGGTANINGIIDSATGDTRISAATDVNLNQAVLNGQTGSALAVNAGRDVNVNAVIDGRGGVAGGAVALNATRNLNVNDYVVTNNGALDLTATNGALTVAGGKGTFSGNAAITMRSGGDLTTGVVSGGSLSATSTGGTVRVNGIIDGNTGRVDLNAAGDVNINQAVLNTRTGSALNATAGRDVNLNAVIDGRGGATGGTVGLKASRDVAIKDSIVTNNGAIGVTAAGGAATMASGTALVSGNAPISIAANGDVTTSGISGGSLSASSSNGSVIVNGVIDGNTGRVDLAAGRDVTINAPVLNTRTGQSLNAAAGQNVNVNARIDGTAGVAGGAVNLTANQNVNVNAVIATHDAAIGLSATNGATTVANTVGLFAGTGAVSLHALGTVSMGTLNGGTMNVTSRGGSVSVTGQVAGNGGAMTIGAAGQVDINHAITNPGLSSPLSITAGTDINVNAVVGRTGPGVPSSSVTLTAGQNVNLNDSIVTEDGAIDVTATNGTVTSAANEGLFAGSGAIGVTSGQTLSVGTVATTGNLTLRSTGGSVNVDTAISGATGAVGIAAATDVNVNTGIANPRADAPLTVTAGRDINVNAAIDGRDNPLTAGSSGTVTMTASNNIALNESIVSRNAAVSLLATNGTVTTAPTKGLFAGSGAIAVTSGATLNTGITSTTGALNLRSTNGGVNVNQAIDDTTGNVTISAGTTVNINQAITNLKSGASLGITAGTDINVLAQVDGRDAVGGGTVNMTAGNNLALTKAVTTNNGAVTLEATHGSITVPVGVVTTSNGVIVSPMEAIVEAGSAPVSLTSGVDFSLDSPVVTSGSLNIASTHGNVNIAAPITDQTGAVTISAGTGVTVRHQVKSAGQPITINAGAGGITVYDVVDYDHTETSPVNSGAANLTLNSVGDVSILDSRGISSAETVTIDTRGQILNGSIGFSADSIRPKSVVLTADGGIASFSTGYAGSVDARSSGGSITLGVDAPGKLRITTGTPGTLDCPTCDINTGGLLGPDVLLNAGGSVNLPGSSSGTLIVIARSRDVNLGETITGQLTADAGRDVNLNGRVYSGGVSLTAGRNIVTTPNSPFEITGGPGPYNIGTGPLSLTAGQDVTLNVVETYGPVTITSANGSITLNNDIGPHIYQGATLITPDLGVASLTMSAPSPTAAIDMQGARAVGNVVIITGGSLTAAKEITSVLGTVSITSGGAQNLSNVPIGDQQKLPGVGFVSPVAAPGPKAPLPAAPAVASNLAAGLPAFAEIAVSTANQSGGGVIQPAGAPGSVDLPGAPGGAGAPAGTSGVNGRPGIPSGSAPAQATGSSEPGTADTASTLRTAGEACREESESESGTGLDALAPAPKKSAEAPDRNKAQCPPAPAGRDAAGASAPAAPVAQSGNSETSAAPLPPSR